MGFPFGDKETNKLVLAFLSGLSIPFAYLFFKNRKQSVFKNINSDKAGARV